MQNGTGNGHLSQGEEQQEENGRSSAANGTITAFDVDVYRVRMSTRFILLSLISCTLLAFAVGRTARMVLIVHPQVRMLQLTADAAAAASAGLTTNSPHAATNTCSNEDNEASDNKCGRGSNYHHIMNLPNPVLKNRPVPQTLYTAMNFDTARSTSITSRFVVAQYDDNDDGCHSRGDGADCPAGAAKAADATNANLTGEKGGNGDNNDEDEVHLPAGQHLLMDIRNVQASFLASEERLAHAMLEVVGSCGLTLLSYHCHGLQPAGVSCVGVLLESHVSFHTWPSRGVITLDLFTCGSQSLLPIVSKVERLFGPPANADGPETIWAYKVRGFGGESPEELADLFTFPIGFMAEYKRELLSTNTNHQRIDVYDVLRPVYQTYQAYKKSLRDDDGSSYESRYKEIFQPDRILFLDGVLQTRRSAEIPYHEALVHPGMFAHADPKRILLLNCGEGAALREVLKHRTVETVVMVDEDDAIVRISKEFFPEFYDCSPFLRQDGDLACSDDPRVVVIYNDLFDWVANQAGSGNSTEPFDVVILDDIYYVDGPAEYGDFMYHLSKLMSNDGVLVAQVGDSPSLDDPATVFSEKKYRSNFTRSLPTYGFQSVVDYEEAHLGFSTPWQFVTAFRDFHAGRKLWFKDSTWSDLLMVRRTLPLGNGETSLLHFDGAVMQSYAYPSRASEVVFCRGNPDNFYCKDGHGFDPARTNLPDSVLEVRQSSLGEHVGRGVFARQDIPVYSYLALSQVVHPVFMSATTHDLAYQMFEFEESYRAKIVAVYGWSYGLSISHHGDIEVYTDSNLLCFLNHGCGGRRNLSYNISVTEATADPATIPEEIRIHQFRLGNEYNPAAERYPESLIRATPIRDISQGEELLINYFALTGNMWADDVLSLKAQCEGSVGDVRAYEIERDGYNGDHDADVQ